MEDLDSLLEDLGRGKSMTSSKKTRPPSSRVDLNELEDLMEDLAAPTSKQTPAPAPVVMRAWTVAEPVKEANSSNQPKMQQPGPSYQANTSSSRSIPTVAESPRSSVTEFPRSSVSEFPRSSVSEFPRSSVSEFPRSSISEASKSSVEDLDDLMESLNATSRSNRRVNSMKPLVSAPPPPDPISEQRASIPVAKPSSPVVPPFQPASSGAPRYSESYSEPAKGDDLDNLLKNLSTQMNSIDGENPSSRGTCGTCNQSILGEIIQALGKSYHPEHFACGNCKQPLGTRNFYEQNGTPFCERCFQELYCPKCGHCDKPVLDRCITALGKKWHVDHFICTQCLKPFGAGNFYEKDGRPYCEADFFALYAPKCTACNEPIRGDCINALGSQWHPEHFVCTYCQKSFVGGSFFEYGGKPYCETHYHQQTGSLCSGCGKPITGRCVNALEKKWHPEHFVCAFCMNPLAGGSFTEHNSKAYCRECHGKLFGGS